MAAELEPSGGSSSQQNSHDIHIKLLMLGDTGVGKTCLLVRYAYDSFSPTFITTIGIDFKIKHLDLDDVKVRCICMLEKMPAEGRVPAGRREAVETIKAQGRRSSFRCTMHAHIALPIPSPVPSNDSRPQTALSCAFVRICR